MSEDFSGNACSSTCQSGARGESLEELLTVVIEYSIQWSESRVDLAELAKLRYIEGWSRKQLATHYGRTEMAIQNYFQKIKKTGGLGNF